MATGVASLGATRGENGTGSLGDSGNGDDDGWSSGDWRCTGDGSNNVGLYCAHDVADTFGGIVDVLAAAGWARYAPTALKELQEHSLMHKGSYWWLILSTRIPMRFWKDSIAT